LDAAARRCWDEVLGNMPDTTLAVRREAFRGLLSGQAVRVEDAANTVGLPVETAREAVELVASVGMAEIDGGLIVGVDGLTTRHTPHRLVLGGVRLWTWCAYDIVGIAAALRADAVGNTQCGQCGTAIEVVLRQGEPVTNTAVGWMPDEPCSNVMAEFCPVALLFCSREHHDDWHTRARPGRGEVLDVEALAERGRRDWSQLVA